ncbi:Ribosomal protein L20, mitochondrial [Lasallia pustulata]|uniref:Ribosomal protein L20, mitochondrial n=1 Tax=Lasallia pustulata TaxID=136370 RepID=A0A1W5D1S9_9LECA|nr:Ribosomal protein L20, mitochondrial [Lasallia pustulata]
MQVIVPRRPFANLPFLFPSFLPAVPPSSRRHESTARRTTKRLRVKPDPTFTSFSPSSVPNQDHIVFNPPSSTPSVYHTPAKFLPASDPRRQLLAQSLRHANPYKEQNKPLPPPVRKPYEKSYHLNEAQIEEIRKLRGKDPFTWTRATLAEKFNCSPLFVALVCQASEKRKEEQRQVLEDTKAGWGRRRTYAREDRTKRRELWGRDE